MRQISTPKCLAVCLQPFELESTSKHYRASKEMKQWTLFTDSPIFSRRTENDTLPPRPLDESVLGTASGTIGVTILILPIAVNLILVKSPA